MKIFFISMLLGALFFAAPGVASNIQVIEFTGPAATKKAELSGLLWWENQLILLPQYPRKVMENRFFTLKKSTIERYLKPGTQDPITPQARPIEIPSSLSQMPGYEGFEAVVNDGEKFYFAIEIERMGHVKSALMTGQLRATGSYVDPTALATLDAPAELANMGYESLLIFGDEVFAFYEANGINVNPQPYVIAYHQRTGKKRRVSFPVTEYRITDVTVADSEGRFWAMNYFYPGEKKILKPSPPIDKAVARIIEFQIQENAIVRTEKLPIILKTESPSRNWEGIVRLDARGFLIVTDEYPRTILAFVSF